MSHKKHIKELEKHLKNNKNLHEIAEYFLTHLGEDRSFTKQGIPIAEHDLLTGIAEKVFSEFFEEDCEVEYLLLTKAPESDFIHGLCIIEGHMITTLFFEESNVGLFAVTLPPHDTHFFRFYTAHFKDNEGVPYYGPTIVE